MYKVDVYCKSESTPFHTGTVVTTAEVAAMACQWTANGYVVGVRPCSVANAPEPEPDADAGRMEHDECGDK